MLILAVKECRVFSRDAARVAIAFHPLVATEFAIGAPITAVAQYVPMFSICSRRRAVVSLNKYSTYFTCPCTTR